MSKIILFVVLLLVSLPTLGQVGINTTNPQEALHVNGKIRVDDASGRSATSVLGVDATGTLNTMDVGGALEIHNNTIIASGTGYYSVVNVSVTTPTPNTRIDNIDLGVVGANAYKTVIRFTGQTQSFDITGIKDGIEGRHIILLNPMNVNMGVINESNQSLAVNRIITYGSGPSESTSGEGAIELVYDGTRWVVINFRN
ncbi:hypothetical protein ATE92_0739 [Ulvibacter sp. MAR_2010_11]|uniref:hypothetical protein n=1 Tax=Ulvibacter sp. MAR_2010_11 TaxID=1250229 RepID=UPI000C2C3AAA|nr:hypothetical protein [Ulvibacter sp. MAR_2010_11]PKA82606.1 hypothetical protein ATE92_0739 [Ulvibacter sp. MAR_2010_11]